MREEPLVRALAKGQVEAHVARGHVEPLAERSDIARQERGPAIARERDADVADADDLAGGMCRTFDEYQKLCGVIQGLATAERHLLDLAEKVEKSDE